MTDLKLDLSDAPAPDFLFNVDVRSNITLSKSTVENLMRRIDKVDKVYLEEIRKNQIGAVVSAQAAQNIAIMSTKRVVLGALADLLLEFLPKDTE